MEKKGILIVIGLAAFFWFTQSPNYVDATTDISLKYHAELTANASKNDDLPIIIALHGNGDTYDNFYKYTLKDFTTPARVILIEAPKKYWPYDPNQLKNYSTAIASFTEKMQEQYSAFNKPMLFGFSGGGVMAYYSALNNCDSYSIIIPVSGMLRDNMLSNRISMDNRCKVLAFHGKSDSVVSFSSGEYAVKELKKHSDEVELISFDAGHHGIFQEYKQMIFDEISKKL